jgi:hypothetical protein
MKKVTVDGVEYVLTDESVEIGGHDVDEDTTCGYCYGSIEDGDELTIDDFVNPENDQKKIYGGLAHVECVEDSRVEQELTLTTQYHDWSNTLADSFAKGVDGEYVTEEDFNREANEFREKAKGLTHSWITISDRVEEIISEVREGIEFYKKEEDEE